MARHVATRGLGTLWLDRDCDIVYGLSLQQGGNILVNTTALLQHSPTLLMSATMGCCLKTPTDSQPTGSLRYPPHNLAKLWQIKVMDTGLKHFGPNELSIASNGKFYHREDSNPSP